METVVRLVLVPVPMMVLALRIVVTVSSVGTVQQSSRNRRVKLFASRPKPYMCGPPGVPLSVS